MHPRTDADTCYPQLPGVACLQAVATFLPFRPFRKPALTFRPLPPSGYLNRLKPHSSRLRTLKKGKCPTSLPQPTLHTLEPPCRELRDALRHWDSVAVICDVVETLGGGFGFVGLQVLCEYAFTGGWFNHFVCHPPRQLSIAEY